MSFYCQNICGRVDFSIEKWNEEFEACRKAGVEMKKPRPCGEQCFDCMAIVGQTRIKNKRDVATS